MDKAELADSVNAELRAIMRKVLDVMSDADYIEINPTRAAELIKAWTIDIASNLDNIRAMLEEDIKKG